MEDYEKKRTRDKRERERERWQMEEGDKRVARVVFQLPIRADSDWLLSSDAAVRTT
jgi:hypothetical protein